MNDLTTCESTNQYILFCSDLQEYAREVLVIMPHRISFIILHQKQQQQKKYKEFNITSQHLGQVIRDHNITRKRTRHEHGEKVLTFSSATLSKKTKFFLIMNIIQKKDMENPHTLRKN